MRRSELVNLKWADVDFLHDAIHVRRAKSREGHRSIAVPKALSDALWSWKGSTPYKADDDYVFACTWPASRSETTPRPSSSVYSA
jgi:integrase